MAVGLDDHEVARDRLTGAVRLRVNPKFYRPLEPSHLVGDPSLARARLQWQPLTIGTAVARAMVEAEL